MSIGCLGAVIPNAPLRSLIRNPQSAIIGDLTGGTRLTRLRSACATGAVAPAFHAAPAVVDRRPRGQYDIYPEEYSA
jgi:hypothetical protein